MLSRVPDSAATSPGLLFGVGCQYSTTATDFLSFIPPSGSLGTIKTPYRGSPPPTSVPGLAALGTEGIENTEIE